MGESCRFLAVVEACQVERWLRLSKPQGLRVMSLPDGRQVASFWLRVASFLRRPMFIVIASLSDACLPVGRAGREVRRSDLTNEESNKAIFNSPVIASVLCEAIFNYKKSFIIKRLLLKLTKDVILIAMTE